MNENNISKLSRELEALRLLKNDSSRLEHAVFTYEPTRDCECWVPFTPTKFIYSIFTFNMLYSINWPKSIENGTIIEFDSGLRNRASGVSESKKMSEYLKFCFSDKPFMETRKQWFKDIVLKDSTPEKLMREMEKIRPDKDMYGRVNNNGNVRAESFIRTFRNSVSSVLTESEFTEGNIYNIYNFIYKVRCNMFHGEKSITVMKDPDQQTILEIYSRFIYAANSLVFDRLDYLNGGNEPGEH